MRSRWDTKMSNSAITHTLSFLVAGGVLISAYRLGYDHGMAEIRQEAVENGAATVERDTEGRFLRIRWKRKEDIPIPVDAGRLE